jgi:hypothetical protein
MMGDNAMAIDLQPCHKIMTMCMPNKKPQPLYGLLQPP